MQWMRNLVVGQTGDQFSGAYHHITTGDTNIFLCFNRMSSSSFRNATVLFFFICYFCSRGSQTSQSVNPDGAELRLSVTRNLRMIAADLSLCL